MAGVQTDNMLIQDESSPYLTRTVEASDIMTLSPSFVFQSDVEVQGNLIAQNVVAVQTEEIRIDANYLLLNDGYISEAAVTGGFAVNYDPAPGTFQTTVAATGFTAGVPATSNPTVNTTAASGLSAGDVIMITGANDEENDGLYEVDSHAANLLTIRGIGTVAVSAGFTGIFEDQFVTDTTVAGTITLTNISIMRVGTDGAWETGAGSNTGSISFTDLGSGTGNTLQQAYDADVDGGDANIVTNATDGAVVIAGTEELRVTATGGLNVDTQFDFDGTVFDVQMSGANGFSLDGGAASNVTVDAGNLTLSTTTSGNVIINSVADIDADAANVLLDATAAVSIDAATSSNLSMNANDAGAQTLTVDATNVGAGAGNMDVNVDDALTIDAGNYSIDATATSNVAVTGGDLLLQTITSGELDLTSAGLMDVNAGANLDVDVTGTMDFLSTGAFSIDGTGASNVTADTGNLTLSTTTSGDIIASSAGDVLVDGAQVSIDGTTSSNLTMTANDAGAQNLTVAATNGGAGTGNLLLSADDEIDLTSASVDVNATGAVTVDGAGVSIDGTAASNLSVTGADLTLSTITSGSVNITSAGDSTYTVPDPSATAFTLTDGTSNYAVVDSTAGAEKLELPTFTQLSGGAGIVLTTNDTLAAGDIVQIETDGDVGLADADTGSLTDGLVVAVSRGAATAGNPAQLYSVPGTIVPVRFVSAPPGSSNGLPCYLSATAGQADDQIPGGPSTRVVFQIGIIQGADGVATTVDVLFMPRFQSAGPSVT